VNVLVTSAWCEESPTTPGDVGPLKRGTTTLTEAITRLELGVAVVDVIDELRAARDLLMGRQS
jgi:hypothetical protein